MLEVCLLQQCSVVNSRIYVCKLLCVELNTSRNNFETRILVFPLFTPSVFALSIPPTWRRVMTMMSITCHCTSCITAPCTAATLWVVSKKHVRDWSGQSCSQLWDHVVRKPRRFQHAVVYRNYTSRSMNTSVRSSSSSSSSSNRFINGWQTQPYNKIK